MNCNTPTITKMDPREKLNQLAQEALQSGKPETWFEPLYAHAGDDPSIIPWADQSPNPNLIAWLDQHRVTGNGRTAIVVGCGLGDDAEELQRRGFRTTAFDISTTAIAWARRRFSTSQVSYHAADLLKLPSDWQGRFEFVFESYTVQAMPQSYRSPMLKAVASLLAPGGELLLICRGREASDDPGSLPWPMTREDLQTLLDQRLELISFEDFIDTHKDPTRRFRAHYRKPI